MTRLQTIAALGVMAVLVGMGQAVAWHEMTKLDRSPVCHVRAFNGREFLMREALPWDESIMDSNNPDDLLALAAKIGCKVKP